MAGGQVLQKWDPYPEDQSVRGKIERYFQGEDSGAPLSGAGYPPDAMGSTGDPLRAVPGREFWRPDEPSAPRPGYSLMPPSSTPGKVRTPEAPSGGGWLRAEEGLQTRTVRNEADEREMSVQRLLNRLGYGLDEDGMMGPESMKAMNSFIRSYVSPELEVQLGEMIPGEVLLKLVDAANSWDTSWDRR